MFSDNDNLKQSVSGSELNRNKEIMQRILELSNMIARKYIGKMIDDATKRRLYVDIDNVLETAETYGMDRTIALEFLKMGIQKCTEENVQ
jgi:hypothetical protein